MNQFRTLFINVTYTADNTIQYEQKCKVTNQELVYQFNQLEDNENLGRFLVQISADYYKLIIPCGVTIIQDQIYNYRGRTRIQQIVIPDSVKIIQNYSFASLLNLQSINIPESVTYIGENAFSQDSQLYYIILPDSIEEIAPRAFQFCSQLIYIRIPEKIQKIQDHTFSYCSNLRQIIIPKNIEIIENYAFSSAAKLQCIEIQNKNCQINQFSFYGTPFWNQNISQFNDTCQQTLSLCDDNQYIYILDSTYSDYCTTAENTQFYYTINGKRHFTQSCKTQEFYINEYPPYECLDSCPEEFIIFNQQCLQYCPYGYAQSYTNLSICLQQCLFIVENNRNLCVINCPEELQYRYYIKQIIQCVDECINIGKYIEQKSKKCIDQCDRNLYLQENNCVDGCTDNYAIQIDSNNHTCINTCMFYQQKQYNYCTEQCPSNYLFKTESQPVQCVIQCQSESIYKYTFTSDNQSVKMCVQNCSTSNMTQNKKYNYYDQSLSLMQCSDNCGNLRIQSFDCVEKCSNEYSEPIDQNDKNCDSTCTFYYYKSSVEDTNLYRKCTESCNQQYKYLIKTTPNECASNCDKQAIYKYKDDLIEPPQCVSECSNNQYKYSNGCTQECDQINNAYNYSSLTCDDECLFYINQENKMECTEKCEEPLIYIQRHITLIRQQLQCVSECDKNLSFIQQLYCQKYCDGEYAQQIDESNKTCINTCIFYTQNEVNYCTETCQGQYQYLIEQLHKCVENCPYLSKYYYIYQAITPVQCVEQCPDEYKYIQGDYCAQECLKGYAVRENNFCDSRCQYYKYNETVNLCMDLCVDPFKYQVVYTTPLQCVKNCQDLQPKGLTYEDDNKKICTQTCLSQKPYNQSYICQEGCTDNYAVNIYGSGYTCNETCMYETDARNMNYCVLSCSYPNQYEVQEERKRCIKNCSQNQNYYFFENLTCVDKCKHYWYISLGDYYCTANDTCTTDINDIKKYNKLEQENNNQCVQQCNHLFWYQKGDQNICTDEYHCKDLIINNINLESFDYYTFQCMPIEQCQQDIYTFIIENNSRCVMFTNVTSCNQVNKLSQFKIYEYQQPNTKQCTNKCQHRWFQYNSASKLCTQYSSCNGIMNSIYQSLEYYNPVTQECVLECPFNWYKLDYYQKYCTIKDDCEISLKNENQLIQDKLQIQTKECVSQCNNKYWYQNKNQLKICTEEQNCQNVIIDNISYSSIDYQNKQCQTLNACTNQSYYYLFKNNICFYITDIQSCNQLQQFAEFTKYIIQSLQPFYCTTTCDEKQVVYNTSENQLTCIHQCLEKQLQAIEIDTKICQDIALCKQYYHLDLHIMNTECQFSKEAQSCLYFKQFQDSQKYTISLEKTNQCTDCQLQNYHIQEINYDKVCVKVDFVQSPQFVIPIVIIIVGLIIAGIVVFIIIKKKKQLKAQKDLEMIQRDKTIIQNTNELNMGILSNFTEEHTEESI